jgi:hypothetical protein
MQTRHLYAVDVIRGLGVPGSLENVLGLVAQMQAEGGSARFNPLNTTLAMPGATDYNGVHVKNYVSWDQGMAATIQTLRQSNMAKLMLELRRGTSARAYWVALGLSPWGTRPPGGMSIDAFLSDVRAHWTDRAMQGIAGT